MPEPEDLERAARAIGNLLRGVQTKTLKKKDIDFLGPQVVEGVRILEEGAQKMRERAGKEVQ